MTILSKTFIAIKSKLAYPLFGNNIHSSVAMRCAKLSVFALVILGKNNNNNKKKY